MSSSPAEHRNKNGWLTGKSLRAGGVEERILGRYAVTLRMQKWVSDNKLFTVGIHIATDMVQQGKIISRHRKYLGARHAFLMAVDKYTLIAAREVLGIETDG
jgi:hypothetical protein